MNFEKVEISGFKSFADKVEIKFNDGITGIVGPNGCGKSNVSDAIRWVLGEQSAKNLRGSNMQDVIFSGTQNRKSLSYCEVSLFFDNTNKIFDVDYNEVIITRKLFRSGESEYCINKQPARLKDIVELLHQCGIGKEGYTIIGQGKVEEIISAKPEDRRAIFEEATGIAHFKTKKNESERKIERTHENLVRINDIITVKEEQLIPLERQAEKAREYDSLSAELKKHELNTYIAKTEGVETAKAKINKRIKGIEEQTALREKELAEAQAEYDKVFKDMNDIDRKLHDLNDERLERNLKMTETSGVKTRLEDKITYLKQQIARGELDLAKNENVIAEGEKTLTYNAEYKSETEKELEKLQKKFREVTGKLISLGEKITLGEETASANTRKVIESIESLSDVKLNQGAMSVEKKNLLDKKKEIMNRIDELSEKREGLFVEKDKCDNAVNDLDRSIYDLKNRIADKENEVRAQNEAVALADDRIYKLNSLVSTLITKDNFYRGMKENYEGYAPAVKLLLNKAKNDKQLSSRIKGVVAEIIKSDKKYDVALETALMSATQNVITSTPDDAKYLIQYLKANKFGRVTFLPISSVKPRERNSLVTQALNEIGALGVADEIVTYDKQFRNVISNLLGNTLIADNIEHATGIANKYRFSFKIVTLDGDVLSTQGAMTGGSRRQDSVGILSGERRIEDNAEQLAQKKEEMETAKAGKKLLEEKRDKAMDDLELLNDMYNEKRQQIVGQREKLSVAETALSDIGKQIDVANDLLKSVDERITAVDIEYREIASGTEKLTADKESAQKRAEKERELFDELKKQRDSLNDESASLQVAITTAKAKIQSIEEENKRVTDGIIEAKAGIVGLKKSNEEAERTVDELYREKEKIALSKEEQEYMNRLREEIENIETYKDELRSKLNSSDEKRSSRSAEISELAEKKHLEELALTKIDSDLENLQGNIWETYAETYETALKYKEDDYDAKAGEQEINRLRRKKNSLGAINASAIEDSKIMRQEYEEFVKQRDDLEKAENDLREGLEKIKTEMLAQFDEGFVKINENFQKTFKELFGGGRAMLQLDYENVDEKLEAGVEIIAEPPGKRLQKLSLLSGGEKALTTIAILFAILKMRPMPFCVLDEIEAALDEANVERFAQYLHNFSKDTQFIVITHKKPTMEKADALFGVTMQEKGVSKIVSVKLSDISEIGDLKESV